MRFVPSRIERIKISSYTGRTTTQSPVRHRKEGEMNSYIHHEIARQLRIED